MAVKKLYITGGSIIPQSDWLQNDETQADYIKNKPRIATDDEVMTLLRSYNIITLIVDSTGYVYLDKDEKILTM